MLKDKEKRKNNEEDSSLQNPARLGPSLSLKGELSGNEDLIIEGKFSGKINLENHDLVIKHGGKVKADIRVKNITINGKVEGNVYASGKVFISKEGKMKGDINAPKISIMDGAKFKGSVKMKSVPFVNH